MKKIQEKIKKFCEENNLKSSPESRILDTMSELGEVAKEILKINDYGKKPIKSNLELKKELGDLLYSLITLANSLDIDLDEALEIVMKKYKNRLKNGSIGSEIN